MPPSIRIDWLVRYALATTAAISVWKTTEQDARGPGPAAGMSDPGLRYARAFAMLWRSAHNQRINLSTSQTSGLVTDMAGLPALVGKHAGYTQWREMEQSRVNQFADATDDHQYIHVDPERAKQSPFGGTIAHGYLTLSLLAPIIDELVTVTDATVGVNYGLDRVRFPAPLPVGAQWRGGAELLEVEEIAGGVQIKIRATIEVKGTEKPTLVADALVRLYR
jgi:acyl dehydratase